jgi:hypothetical protein
MAGRAADVARARRPPGSAVRAGTDSESHSEPRSRHEEGVGPARCASHSARRGQDRPRDAQEGRAAHRTAPQPSGSCWVYGPPSSSRGPGRIALSACRRPDDSEGRRQRRLPDRGRASARCRMAGARRAPKGAPCRGRDAVIATACRSWAHPPEPLHTIPGRGGSVLPHPHRGVGSVIGAGCSGCDWARAIASSVPVSPPERPPTGSPRARPVAVHAAPGQHLGRRRVPSVISGERGRTTHSAPARPLRFHPSCH